MKKTIFLFLIFISNNIFASDLFNAYPSLREKLSRVELCDLPTPITKLEIFGEKIGHQNCFMKRDDLTGKKVNGIRLYGGNKVRKLEFLFGDALAKNAKTIVTFGAAGSNHARATAEHAKQSGLECVLMLTDQFNSEIVQKNLLADYASGARVLFYPNSELRASACELMVKNDPLVYQIPVGGSNKIGVIGFVNAAFELQKQIKEGVVSEPDYIYVTVGSCGTVSGLLLGLSLCCSKIKVIGVPVVPHRDKAVYQRVCKLFFETNSLLREADNSIPLCDFPHDNFIIHTECCGSKYGLWSQENIFAVEVLKKLEGIMLEGTYSAKIVNAFLHDFSLGKVTEKDTVILWNTYCGIETYQETKEVSYTELPIDFHKYFTEDTQPLLRLIQ